MGGTGIEGGACALCGATDGLVAYGVEPRGTSIAVCGTCAPQLDGPITDVHHWYCLQGAVWSDVPAVQVVCWRLLQRLTEDWALELREQLVLDDDTLVWAQDGQPDARPITVDSNGTPLADGDAVTLIKDLPVKGANFTAKRGTLVKNIRLSDDPELVEGRVHKTAIFLKTAFLKRA